MPKPELRKDNTYGHRYMLQNIYYFVPGVGFFALLFLTFEHESIIWPIIGGIGFAVSFGIGVHMDRYRFSNYRCPQCGQRTPRNSTRQIEHREALIFHCKECNIDWDCGLSTPD